MKRCTASRFLVTGSGFTLLLATQMGTVLPLHSDPQWENADALAHDHPLHRIAETIVDVDARGRCSGTIVGIDLILTARHCVADDQGRVVEEGWVDADVFMDEVLTQDAYPIAR